MSEWLRIGWIVLACVIGLAVLVAAVRSRRPLRSLFGSGLQGLCALGLVNFLGAFTNVAMGVGWLTAGTAAALGIPGVIALLLLNLMFSIT